jgi:hypothetical protein
MPDPAPRSPARLLWPLLIALLAVLAIIFMLNPSGDTDEPGVSDPIVLEDFGEPVAPADPLDFSDVPPPPDVGDQAGPPVERQPTETPLPMPAPAVPGQPAAPAQ